MYDKETTEWFRSHIVQQTTLCRCEKCGLYYKSSLGHRCRKWGNRKEYVKPVTKKMKCISCGADVIADVSKYNGHIRYSCAKCGASVMS